MSEDADNEVLSMEELDEVLAEATGTTAEEIRHGAEEMYLAPPKEATVIDE
jgi:hypothetical protein